MWIVPIAVSELARSMRTVKLNNWEPFFEAKIGQLRSRELDHLRRIKYLDAVCVYLWVGIFYCEGTGRGGGSPIFGDLSKFAILSSIY